MLHPCTRLAAVAILALAGAVGAEAQEALTGPSDGRVLWLRGGSGVEHGFSGLVSAWSGADSPAVYQAVAAYRPRRDRFGIAGRPSLHFDGNDGLVRGDGMPVGDYTKVAVVRLDDYESHNNILSGESQHALFYGFGDRAMLYHDGSFVVSTQPTALGEPTVLVATYDATSTEGRLYQNGAFVGSGFAAPHSDPTLQVGSFANSANLRGSIAEAMIYDRVLSDAEREKVERRLLALYRSAAAPVLRLDESPLPGAVLARDASDRAAVTLAGTVEARGLPELELRLLRDGAPVDSVVQPLSDPFGTSPFSLATTLEAGLYEYDLELWLRDGARRIPVAEVRSLLCGDLLLVNGQSNAVAGDYHGEGKGRRHQSPWLRSFGTATLDASVGFDLHWDLAEAEGFQSHGSVGMWGLRVAELLMEGHAIPIGLLNGGVGGTSVAQHQRNDLDPTDVGTIYGRLLLRCREAGIAEDVRALLWHQGESDGENVAGWEAGFAALRADWAEDYPGVEKLFLFQIRKGCGVALSGVREAQRQLADDPGVAVMSTTAVQGHDSCHYGYLGYRVMGNRMHRLVDRDLYGSTDTQDIDPPNLDFAEWTDASQTAVRLVFRDPDDTLDWEPGTEDFVLLSDGSPVVSATVVGNTVVLQLSQASSATHISYDGHAGPGPFLRNARGVGALTFFDVPIW